MDGQDFSRTSLAIARIIEGIMAMVNQNGYQTGMGPAQWAALRYFNEANPESATILSFADNHATTRGTASRRVKSLVEKGLLERRQNTTDARSHRVVVTGTGKELLEKDPIFALVAAIQRLEPDARSDLSLLLRQVISRFEP